MVTQAHPSSAVYSWTRRRLFGAIGVLATGSLLQACASASTSSSPTPAQAPAPTAAAAQTGQPIEVVQTGLTADYPNFPELLQLYAKQAPNVKIVTGPQQGGSGSTLAQLKTEGSNTQVSLVLFGQALGPAMRDADLFQPFTPDNTDKLRPTDRDAKGTFYSWALWTPAFIYNQDLMPQPPTSYADLLHPSTKISYDDPTTSASGLIFLVGAIKANGGTIENADPGFAYLEQLKPQVATYNTGGAQALANVQKGEVALAIHYSEANMYNKYLQNAPIGIVVPKDGMPLSALSVAISKYAPQAAAAKDFVNFLLSTDAQQLLAQRYFRPARTDITVPDEVRAKYPQNYDADYAFDWESILPYQQAWLDRWSQQIK